MKVKVIRSDPKRDQLGIDGLIGQTYSGTYNKEDDTVAVHAVEFNGQIILNRSEYEIVKTFGGTKDNRKIK